MRIEDEIRIKEFPSKQQKLSINLIFTHFWAYEKLQTFFGEHGLTSQQYNVLRILRGQYPEGLTTSEILQRMMEKSAGVSRLVDRLVKKGLVRKSVSNFDKRLVDVTINQKGLQIVENMDSEKQRIDEIYSNLTEQEVDTMNTLLDKMRG
jgi:DNA-binding MarR family transcriptional regulator